MIKLVKILRPCNSTASFFLSTAINHLFQKDARLLQTQVRVTLRVQHRQWTRSRRTAGGGRCNARELCFCRTLTYMANSLYFVQILLGSDSGHGITTNKQNLPVGCCQVTEECRGGLIVKEWHSHRQGSKLPEQTLNRDWQLTRPDNAGNGGGQSQNLWESPQRIKPSLTLD